MALTVKPLTLHDQVLEQIAHYARTFERKRPSLKAPIPKKSSYPRPGCHNTGKAYRHWVFDNGDLALKLALFID